MTFVILMCLFFIGSLWLQEGTEELGWTAGDMQATRFQWSHGGIDSME
jgi:hypothetical protein